MISVVASSPKMIYNVYHKGGSNMNVIASKWGNSIGIRIPSGIADELSIKNGDSLNCELKDNSIIIRKKPTAKEIYEDFYGKPFDEITTEDLGSGGELDWGKDVGGEIIL